MAAGEKGCHVPEGLDVGPLWAVLCFVKDTDIQAVRMCKMQSTPHFSGSLFPSIRRLRQHHMANLIKGNQSHILWPPLHLQSWSLFMCGYPRCCGTPTSDTVWGTWLLSGNWLIPAAWGPNTLPETSEVPLQILATGVQAFIFPWQIHWSSVPFTP